MVVIVWQLDLQLPMQSVPTTTKFVNLHPTHGEAYSIQHYVIKLSGWWFSLGTLVSSTNKTDHHEILLTVVLNTITLTPNPELL